MAGTWILRDAYEWVATGQTNPPDATSYANLITGGGRSAITGVAWYRNDTTHDPPVSLSIWDFNTSVRVWKTTDVPDDGTVGWQEVDLSASPIEFSGDVPKWFVGAYVATGGHLGLAGDGAPARGEEVGAKLDAAAGRRRVDTADAIPNTTYTNQTLGLDTRVAQAYSSPGVGSGDVDAALASYLTATGANYAGSPLADIKTTVETTFNDVEDASTGLSAIKADTQSLLDRLTVAWRDTVASNTEGIPGFLTQWDDFYTQFVNITAPAVADLVDAIGTFTGITVFSYLAALIRFANGIDAPPQLADTPDWELVDETDFTNNLLWPVEADVYRVTLSAFDPAGTSEPVGTETRHAYLGKWCPFNVQFSSEWHYFNTASADLALGGRMPGLGLILYRPGAGHVQAWRRVEAP